MVTIDDFMKIDLRVAEIKEAWEHPNADKLLVLKVNVGEAGGEKQLVAGIREDYTPDQLIGKKIIVVNNLEPAVLRGEESHGMLLAARDEKRVVLLSTESDIAPGSRAQ
ncbi:MAG: methionine--tRNA ligase subunit beta [Planctomycetes bacterium]|nr:methionine--tRNA ligase subunit beta [Planctomycetota bacterium]